MGYLPWFWRGVGQESFPKQRVLLNSFLLLNIFIAEAMISSALVRGRAGLGLGELCTKLLIGDVPALSSPAIRTVPNTSQEPPLPITKTLPNKSNTEVKQDLQKLTVKL